MKDEKNIKDMLKEAQSYFGDDEKISYEMECPYCGGKSFPIDLNIFSCLIYNKLSFFIFSK